MSASHLRADLEGVCIYRAQNGLGYVIVSSQGNSTYAIYDRLAPYAYRGSFEIRDPGGSFGSTQETDGIEVVPGVLSADYPFGMFLAHDAKNSGGLNIKLVKWDDIADPLGLLK